MTDSSSNTARKQPNSTFSLRDDVGNLDLDHFRESSRERDKLTEAYRDIVAYEQRLGGMLADIASREAELQEKDRIIEAQNHAQLVRHDNDLRNALPLFMKVVADQQRQFSNLYELILKITTAEPRRALFGKAPISEEITSAGEAGVALTRAYTELLGPIALGSIGEKIHRTKIDVNDVASFSLIRAHAEVVEVDAPNPTMVLSVTESETSGVHSVVFDIPSVDATGFRAVHVSVKAGQAKFIRLRVRQKSNHSNSADCVVDLSKGYTGEINGRCLSARRDIVVTRRAKGWWNIALFAGLENSLSAIQVEVISLNGFKKRSKFSGTKGRGFLLKSLGVDAAGQILKEAQKAAAEAGPEEEITPNSSDTNISSKAISYSVKMPVEEKKRKALREAYLQSGAYTRIAALKNIHAGRRAFILGNGPSINSQNLTLLKNEVTFATNWFVNHPRYAGIDPKYYCVSSHEMFGGWRNPTPQANRDWLASMTSKAGNSTKILSYRFRDYIESQCVFPSSKCQYLLFDKPKYQVDIREDINLDLSQPMDDGYTGVLTFCLPLAIHMGIKEIYLVGCDCDYAIQPGSTEKAYFYDYSQHKTSTTKIDSLERVWADDGPVFKAYEVARDRCALEGVSIVNCTAGGRLEVFPRAKYEDVVSTGQSR